MDRNPLEKIFDQIAELMQFAYDHANQPISIHNQQELDQQIKLLEKNMEQLNKMSSEFVSKSGITDYAYQAMMEDDKSEGIAAEDRTLLKRAEELKQEAKKASQDVIKAAEDAKSSGKRLSNKGKSKKKSLSPAARKSKFKTQGGYKNWKPL
jgi:translation initiation factor 2B subunit (eIF-2B alpha/beta/delta family)